jgi:hypothetical protein
MIEKTLLVQVLHAIIELLFSPFPPFSDDIDRVN